MIIIIAGMLSVAEQAVVTEPVNGVTSGERGGGGEGGAGGGERGESEGGRADGHRRRHVLVYVVGFTDFSYLRLNVYSENKQYLHPLAHLKAFFFRFL